MMEDEMIGKLMRLVSRDLRIGRAWFSISQEDHAIEISWRATPEWQHSYTIPLHELKKSYASDGVEMIAGLTAAELRRKFESYTQKATAQFRP